VSARTLDSPGNLDYAYIMDRISRYLARFPYLGSEQLVSIINGTSVNTVTLPSLPPAIPTDLGAADGATTEIVLSWTAPELNVGKLSYGIEQGTSADGPWTRVTAPNLTATTFTVTGLTMGTDYFFRVFSIVIESGESSGRTDPVEHTSP